MVRPPVFIPATFKPVAFDAAAFRASDFFMPGFKPACGMVCVGAGANPSAFTGDHRKVSSADLRSTGRGRRGLVLGYWGTGELLMLPAEKIRESAQLLARLHLEGERPCKFKYVTAESLTAGMIASAIADIPGASAWLERGFIVYNNKAKHEMLGVPLEVLECCSELSLECVSAMAIGALLHADADLSVAVSGVAGPDGGTPLNPVGTVYMGVGVKMTGEAYVHRFHFAGSRLEVRQKTTVAALTALVRFSVSLWSSSPGALGNLPGQEVLQRELEALESDA